MEELRVGTIIMGLVGGLALFLYGMEKLTDTLKIVAGDRLRGLLARMTSNRFKGVLTGAFITATVQSSSVTTVLVVGFIAAGILSLLQAIPIIMGASIGTTITAQIVAFKVTHYSLAMIALGFLLSVVGKTERIKSYGNMILGLGLLFFGMELMKESTSPLRDYEPFIEAMRSLRSPFLGVLISALFTALVQSSSATTGVIIVLASQGFLTLEAGIALVLGANIGTCVTALLASIGKPRESVRAALVHVMFNTAGVVLWIGFVDYLADFVRMVSPVAEGLAGIDKLKAEAPRQVANAHTVFNTANTLLFIGFTPLMARAVEWLVPDRKPEEEPAPNRGYLNDILVHTPSLAIDMVRMELAPLGATALRMVKGAITPVLRGSESELDELEAQDEEVDSIHGALVTYIGRLSGENLSTSQSLRLGRYLSAANYFESIGDMIENDLVETGRRRLADGLEISPSTQEILQSLHEKVQWAVARTTEAIVSSDEEAATDVIRAKKEINRLATEAEAHLATRLGAAEPNRLAVFRIESELVEALKRIYYFAKRIAYAAAEKGQAVPVGRPKAGDDPEPLAAG